MIVRWFLDEATSAGDIENRVAFQELDHGVPGGTFAPLFEAFIDWKNRAFLDAMSRDVRRGLRANVAAGYAPGGTPPTGYRVERIEAELKRDGQPAEGEVGGG